MSVIPKKTRLNKALADAGIGSRRLIDRLIESERVTVNGVLATLGALYEPGDMIEVDREPVFIEDDQSTTTEILMLHKPIDMICSRSDEKGRETIFDIVPNPSSGRWVSIGRLDYKTTGLILLTNNGDLAHKMMHPSTEIEREYHVKVQGICSPEALKQLYKGVQLEDGFAQVSHVSILNTTKGEHTWLSVVIKEGRNREIRRMFDVINKSVVKLTRVRYGNIMLSSGLHAGESELLSSFERKGLMFKLGMKG